MSKYIIALDAGTTNTKVVVFDTEGNEILITSRPTPASQQANADWLEQDMQQVWDLTAEALQEVFNRKDIEIRPEDVLAVVPTGRGNGLIGIDANGELVTKGIQSSDFRSKHIFSEWAEDGRIAEAQKRVRSSILPGSPMPLAAWYQQNDPETLAKIAKVLFAKDWVRYKLSGSLVTDPTDASGAALMNVPEGGYATEVFDQLGVGFLADLLPEIRPSHEIVGHVTEEGAAQTGLLPGTPVLCGVHDIGAYPYGVGSLNPKEIVSVVGTWGISMAPAEGTDGLPTAMFHSVPNYYLTGLGDGNSGAALDVMIAHLCAEEQQKAAAEGVSIYDYLERELLHRKPSGIVFLPHLFGGMTNPEAAAAFVGIRNWHERPDIIRAVFEGIVMGHLANLSFIPGYDDMETLWLIGGGSKSKLFGQLFADITGRVIKVPVTEEVTARGGALHALVGLGLAKDHHEAAIPAEIRAEFHPNPDLKDFYAKKYGVFQELATISPHIWTTINQLEHQEY